MESILTSIKKLLGITKEYTHFDADLIFHINSALMILNQIGVGPENCFFIEDDGATWTDFLGDNTNLELVKSYVYFKVKLMFDPPTSSAAMDATNRIIAEFESRLNMAVDPKNSE